MRLPYQLSRRRFVQSAAALAGLPLMTGICGAADKRSSAPEVPIELPMGKAPPALDFPHFPSRLHAFVWRNWSLVPLRRMAAVVGATAQDISRLGRAMGLPPARTIRSQQWRRSYITIIRRNWHLLPYPQLLQLLGWTAAEMAYTLREDDFLWVKLGNLKPACEPLRFTPSDETVQTAERHLAQFVQTTFPRGAGRSRDPLFGFVDRLSASPSSRAPAPSKPDDKLRFCYSYFALYGDPLLEPEADPYPDGYLARLASAGVNGVWLQAVLYKLAPFPWDPSLSERWQERLRNLGQLVRRARRHGIGVWLYLNEPRAMPLRFFERHPELKGVVEGEFAALCTSAPAVQGFMRDAVASICRAVPDLAGFFTITASENLSNCWSHGGGAQCPRCRERKPESVVAEISHLLQSGIRAANASTRVIAWDWGWADAWAEAAIRELPPEAALMSVSEWSLPIERGGVKTEVGEYSISSIGPGPRAQRQWAAAQKRGLRAIAKIQAGNTWELSAIPYIPALARVARHAVHLRQRQLDGLMLGWTLGGYPSPNLEVVAEANRLPLDRVGSSPEEVNRRVAEVMDRVARQRYGDELAPVAVRAWEGFSQAFGEYPYHGGVVYNAPQQMGPANLLWAEPTGYSATMVGIPYDDLDGWRAVYPAEVFASQFRLMADGFAQAVDQARSHPLLGQATTAGARALREELRLAEAASIHFRSVANQAQFVLARRALTKAASTSDARSQLDSLERIVRDELSLAQRLHGLQCHDSRLGFEATNHYYYVPLDLAEKALNCRDLLERWLPAQRARFPA